MKKKHGNIQQVDGDDTINEDMEEDKKYLETSRYWKTGKLGTIFQTFLDVNAIIDGSNLSEESKIEERAKAFGSEFHCLPPWNVKL